MRIILAWCLSLGALTWAQDPVGHIIKIRGQVERMGKITDEVIPLAMDKPVYAGDTVTTYANSFAKIRLQDNSTIMMGPLADMQISSFHNDRQKRKILLDQITGQLRIYIRPALKENDIKVNSKTIAIGIRGTKFMSNAYSVKKKQVGDFMLLAGQANVDIGPLKKQSATVGEAINSQQVTATGKLSGQKLTHKSLDWLKQNPDRLLPQLQAPDGSFIDVNQTITNQMDRIEIEPNQSSTSSAPAVSKLPLGNKGINVGPSIATTEPLAAKIKSQVEVTESSYAKEPWDIRDAFDNYAANKASGKCYYWIYKKVPGNAFAERFRRETDCDDLGDD